ncbi:unnamed protein product [Rotaria sp. Silwood1]|nr:unnamed protein product [Rotaria sp. Silwood1]
MKQNAKFRVTNQTRSDSPDSSTFTLTSIPVLDTNTNKNKPLTLDGQVTKAEILWSLKVTQKGLSYKLCDELNELFSSIFPDSSIVGNFSIQADKMSYVISHGLGPYFKKKLIEDVKKADKYWSNEKQCAVNRFYKSVILGHAYTKTICDIIIESFTTDGLNLNKLLIQEDYKNVSEDIDSVMEKAILYFSITRWVLLGKVIDRILVELVDRSWYIKDEYVDSNGNNQIKYHSIDYYWNNVFSILTKNGISKYPTLTKLIKNVLIITHGNADVERGFSINSNILRENRSSLSESSINGPRLVYDKVKLFGSGSAHKVPITTDMINMVKKSSSNYREGLIAAKLAIAIHNNEENNNKMIQNEKQQHLEEEKMLLDKQKTLAHQMKQAENLIEEGTNRLEGALTSGVFSEVHAAKLLIAGGREKLTSINEQQQQLTNELDKVRLKRKNAFFHEQSINKKLKSIQQNQHNIMDLIDNT